MPVAFVFPGQGSQEVGMGADLFDAYPALTREADDILGYSIKDLCVNDSGDCLGKTRYTQPALYVVNALSYHHRLDSGAPAPDYLAGHSLGEYNALYAAKSVDFGTGLRLVKKRGDLMSDADGGGMAAVVGIPIVDVRRILAEQGDTVDVANLNSPGQTVISGPKADIDSLKTVFQNEGAKMYVPLKVSGAFHSRYMRDAQREFSDYLANYTLRPCAIPVIANSTAAVYEPEPNSMAATLAGQISNSVRWTECMNALLAIDGIEIEEVGPGTVLTRLLRQIRRGR